MWIMNEAKTTTQPHPPSGGVGMSGSFLSGTLVMARHDTYDRHGVRQFTGGGVAYNFVSEAVALQQNRRRQSVIVVRVAAARHADLCLHNTRVAASTTHQLIHCLVSHNLTL